MSGKELDDMTLEKFKFWKVPALKDFLRKRNLSCVGTKEMLVARVFAKKIRPVYMCKICDKQILESDQMITDEDQSIQCDKCRMWVHWVCVGLFCDSEELGEDEWICNTCKFIPGNL